MDKTAYYIDVGYACYGIVVINNRVVEAPPIARWMIGERWTRVNILLLAKGAKIEKLILTE